MMGGFLSLPAAAGVLLLGLATAHGAGPTLDQVSAATGVKILSVRPVVEWPGLYEAIGPGESVFYVDAGATYVLAGQLVELRTLRNLSQEALDAPRAMAFNSLPLEHAIVRRKGNGSRRLAVFADPDCPFCAKLEESLQHVTDVTTYVLPLPLDELHPGASEQMRRIWCATSPADAWESWLLRREAPPPGDAAECAAPVAAVRGFAEQAGIGGTPLIVFASGRVVYGSLAPVTLEFYLDEKLR